MKALTDTEISELARKLTTKFETQFHSHIDIHRLDKHFEEVVRDVFAAANPVKIDTGSVHTDPECVFNYCPQPGQCKAEGKCKNQRANK